MTTSKEVTALRKSGKLDEAYTLSLDLIDASGADDWDRAAYAWCLIDLVIFELGYFAGKLGRGRACLMRKGAVEIPSDLHGVIYTDLDQAEGWKMKLVRELKAAKLDFDANRMWG